MIFVVLFVFLSSFLLFSQGYKGKGKIKGFIYDEQGKPLEKVKVKLFCLKASSGFQTTTDINGEWKALWIRGGKWNIDFEKIGYEIKKISADVNEWQPNPDIEIKLKKIEGLMITEELKAALEKGNQLFDEKKYEEAIKVYQSILQESPEIYIVNLNIGHCYFQMEKYEQAEEYYKKVLEKVPENRNALIAIGNCYINLGKKQEAITWYNKVKFEEINDATALYNIGNSLYESSQWNDALKYYQRAVEIQDNFLEARYQLGLTYVSLGKFEEALKKFENYLSYDPDSARATQVKSFIDYLKKEIEKKKKS